MMKLSNLIMGASLLAAPYYGVAQSDCTPYMQVSNEFENGLFMEAGGQELADDFSISANTSNFSATQMALNVLSIGGIDSVDVMFYESEGDAPGASYGTAVMGLVPTSQDNIGAAFGYDVLNLVLDFPTAVDFVGTGTGPVSYFVQVVAYPTDSESQVAWESTSNNVMGSPGYFKTAGSSDWMLGTFGDLVYSLSGECTYIEGCLLPENVSVPNVTTTSADVEWSEVGSAVEWDVEYGPEGFTLGTGTVITDDDGTPGLTLTDLDMITSYDVYVRSICGVGDTSAATGPVTFVTADTYCSMNTVTFNVEPITHVVFSGIDNTTSAVVNSSPAHEFFLDQMAAVDVNATYPITVEGNSDGPYSNSFTLFVDWDQDGTFNNGDERYDIGILFSTTGEDGQQATTDVVVPDEAMLGTTRMRVVKMYTSSGEDYPEDACTEVTYGQTEDYTVTVGSDATVDFDKYGFSYFPNPTVESVTLKSTENIEKVAIYNVLGQEVFAKELNVLSPSVSLSNLGNGTYFMQVTIAGEAKTFKVTKQ